MAAPIEVRVAGRGIVRAGAKQVDDTATAHCDLCDRDADVVVSAAQAGGAPFACRDCLRQRLEATTIAMYELRKPGTGLPWGKLTS